MNLPLLQSSSGSAFHGQNFVHVLLCLQLHLSGIFRFFLLGMLAMNRLCEVHVHWHSIASPAFRKFGSVVFFLFSFRINVESGAGTHCPDKQCERPATHLFESTCHNHTRWLPWPISTSVTSVFGTSTVLQSKKLCYSCQIDWNWYMQEKCQTSTSRWRSQCWFYVATNGDTGNCTDYIIIKRK